MLSRSANRATPVEVLESCPERPVLPSELWTTIVATASGTISGIASSVAEAFAYSSGLAAAVGGSVTYAVGAVLGATETGLTASLVATSAFFIYGLDRLRDVERDGAASPRRSAFVMRHRRLLRLATAVAALGVAGLTVAAPARIALLCLPIGALGVFHRRLKDGFRWKVGYVASAWTAACVGLPWLFASGRLANGQALWALAFVGPSLVANLIASNLRDGKAIDSAWSRDSALGAARFVVIAAAALIVVAPTALTPLAFIPAAEAIALWFFRTSERYGQFAVDGALLAGALVAAGLSA